jgi:segregation and condensation protein B
MEEQDSQQAEIRPDEPVTVEELIPSAESDAQAPIEDAALRAVIEAIIYVAEEPLTVAQMANALNQPAERVQELIAKVAEEFERPEHGLAVREVAGGYKMATKPEHHEAVRAFAKSLKPPLKLSLAALETLAVIAYKQPVTVPEIQEIRGVQGAGVVKTLLDRKLVVPAGRKNVVGKPILYKTTKEFLIQFGLKDLSELPSLKEFEEIRRMAFADTIPAEPPAPSVEAAGEKLGPQPVPEAEMEPVAEPAPAAAPEAVSEAAPLADARGSDEGDEANAEETSVPQDGGEQES